MTIFYWKFSFRCNEAKKWENYYISLISAHYEFLIFKSRRSVWIKYSRWHILTYRILARSIKMFNPKLYSWNSETTRYLMSHRIQVSTVYTGQTLSYSACPQPMSEFNSCWLSVCLSRQCSTKCQTWYKYPVYPVKPTFTALGHSQWVNFTLVGCLWHSRNPIIYCVW